ncbi:hypothetical protein [Rummeliibacillus pycnus]|uniref:hypothetical protein n=1 Tax=Rummeliibacillus pycnus TaxID=101070 RepID=UPI003D29E459
MSHEERLKKTKEKLLALAPIKDDSFRVLMETARILTEHMAPYVHVHARPIVVGGLSVEFYTHNDYTTRDLDIVTSSSMRLRQDLNAMGFNTDERVFILDELELVVDIVDSTLEGDYNLITEIPMQNEDGNDVIVSMISLEDIIIDRLDASEHEDPRYWGYNMFVRYHDKLDLDYIERQVKTKFFKTQQMFTTWKEQYEKLLNKLEEEK